MKFNFAMIVVAALTFTSQAMSDPIEGVWKRPNGILVKIAPCANTYCATAASGPHIGGHAGKLGSAIGGKYTGVLTDLENGNTYSGKGSITGNTMTISGCILGGLICKSESWERQ